MPPAVRKTVSCEVERIVAMISGRWKLLILRELFAGPQRPARLRRALPGLSVKVLTAQLRALEKDGIVQRQDYGTALPRVEYSLTPFGRKLRTIVLSLHRFAEKEMAGTTR